jgi:hypothetical protein
LDKFHLLFQTGLISGMNCEKINTVNISKKICPELNAPLVEGKYVI